MSQVLTQHGERTIEAEAWLASLPAPLGTYDMARLAPDITQKIASVWDDASTTSELIEQLLIGDDATPMPYEVTSGLLRLYEYNVRCRANDAPDTTWELPAERRFRIESNAALQENRR